jgi:hypothetical protein
MVMGVARRGDARRCGALGEGAAVSVLEPLRSLRPGAPLGLLASAALNGKACGELSNTSRKIAFTSSVAAVCRRRDRPVRQNIIGHSISGPQQRVARAGRFLGAWRMLPLLNQVAREHGCRVFLHPLIEKRGNLLAEIGRMVETREFIALERIARSREQELPRWLRAGTSHGRLLEILNPYSNRSVINVQPIL